MRKSRRQKNRIAKNRSTNRIRSQLTYDNLEVRNLLAGDIYPGVTDLVNLEEPVALSDGMQLLRDHLNLGENESMELVRIVEDRLGNQHFKYQQLFDGTKVENGIYTLHTEGSEIVRLSGEYQDIQEPVFGSFMNSEAALEHALEYVGATTYAWQDANFAEITGMDLPDGELVFLAVPDSPAVLTYKFDVFALEPFSRDYIYVDASSGEIVKEYSRIRDADVAATGTALYEGAVSFTADSFDNNGTTEYRLRQMVQGVETYELNGSSDYGTAVDITNSTTDFTDSTLHKGVQGHFATETTYNYFLNEHALDSFDGNGSTLISYLGHPIGTNAFWNGSFMTYGDGNGSTIGPLVTLDIAGHEIGHGVTEFSSNLVYANEPGALNESFSDIYGELVENYGAGPNDWIIGADANFAIRSMSNPNAFNDPDTYLGDFWHTSPSDFGGVHTNSGVQNKWFYILSVGEAGVNDNGENYDVTGIGIDDAAAIAYRNNSIYLSVNSQYQDARDGAVQAAIDLFGAGSQQHVSTDLAWRAVGLYGPEIFITALDSVSEGSAMYSTEVSDEILPGVPDSIFIDLDQDQKLSVLVHGKYDLIPTVQVVDVNDNVIATGVTYGSESVIQLAPIDDAGEYTIVVGGQGGTFGSYDVQVLLNGQFEGEGFSQMDNGTMGAAEDFNGSSLELATGVDRLGLIGELSPDETIVTDSEDFEVGLFSSDWVTSSSNAGGRVRILGDYGAAGGSLALVMDQALNGTNNLNEAIWTVDLSQADQPILSFWHAEWNDETTSLPDVFNNSRNGDGVSVSVDGMSWYTILTDANTAAGEWNQFTINLGEFADANDLALGSDVKIKFQQYDDGPLDVDGRGYDEISIAGAGVVNDWYEFELPPGELASIAAEELGAGTGIGLALYDADGNEIQQSLIPSETQFINKFENTGQNSTFYLNLSGADTRYSLVVTRNTDFETTASQAEPQNLDGIGSVLGSTSAMTTGIAEPDSVANGVDISGSFEGVTLSKGPNGGPVYSVDVSYGAPTGESIFSPDPANFAGWQEGAAEFRADFDTLQSRVSVDVGSDDGANDVSFLRAYDIYDNLLAERRSQSLASGDSETLEINLTRAEIAYITAGGLGNDVAPVDNLVYEIASPDTDVYTFNTVSGTQLDIMATLPGSGPYLFDNGLATDTGSNLQLELFAPDGTVVATGSETISHLAMQDGEYLVKVSTAKSAGEYFVSVDDTYVGRIFYVGNTDYGIAVDDFAVGTGFIMYSVENLFSRFDGMWPRSSQHLIAVRYNDAMGSWEYNANLSEWYSFDIAYGDRLIATLDFDNDTVTSLQGDIGHFEQMNKGFIQSDLVFIADSFAGNFEDGEFQVQGTYFVVPGDVEVKSVGDNRRGIAVYDFATGIGYIMYSQEKLSTRFDNVWPNTAEHLIAVRYEQTRGVWQYNANYSEWNDFDIAFGDRLVASVDFDTDSINTLQGSTGTVHGIYQGYLDGDLRFEADRFAGKTEEGEFEVFGSVFEIRVVETTTVGIGNTDYGIAVDDFAGGSGYILYSEQNVFSRFPSVWPRNAQHLIAVRYDSSLGEWTYNDNTNNWYAFTPNTGDRLVAEVDFDNDIVTVLRGVTGQENGIDKGIYDGDIAFQPNFFADNPEDGEFGVKGSFFQVKV